MCLYKIEQICGIKNKIITAGLPEPFLKHKEQCPLKILGTDYPEHIKTSLGWTKTQKAYIGMLWPIKDDCGQSRNESELYSSVYDKD